MMSGYAENMKKHTMRFLNIKFVAASGVFESKIKGGSKSEGCIFDGLPVEICKEIQKHINRKIKERETIFDTDGSEIHAR